MQHEANKQTTTAEEKERALTPSLIECVTQHTRAYMSIHEHPHPHQWSLYDNYYLILSCIRRIMNNY